MKKVLLAGNGAREHAIAKALKKSKTNIELYVLAGSLNPGIKALAHDYKIGDLNSNEQIVEYAKASSIDWAIIGPETQLVNGVVDALLEAGVPSVGPQKELAQLEGSKSFTRDLLREYKINASPEFKTFKSPEGLVEWIDYLEGQFVIKPDGLTGGKGVRVIGDHFSSKEDGLKIAQDLISNGEDVVIEEKLIGQEFSLISFCDGENLLHTPAIQDHKRVGEGDTGPNTGGMGTYSLADFGLPFLDSEDVKTAQGINGKIAKALKDKFGKDYKGILYGGFIKTKKGIKVIEYNARFGDPEAMNILVLFGENADFYAVCEAIIEGNLDKINCAFDRLASVCKYAVPSGYPDNPVKDEIIDASEIDESKVDIFYAAVDERDGEIYLTGSRAIAIVAVHEDVYEAEKLVEAEIQKIKGPVIHRADIGTKELIEKRVKMMEEIMND